MRSHSLKHLYLPKDEMILSHYGEILRQLVIERGGDGERLLDGTGIRPAVLANAEGRLSYEQFISLVRNAIRLTNEPALGVYYGQRLNPMTHGSLGQAVMSAANIQEALEIMMKYYKTRLAAITFSFFVEGDRAIIQLEEHINLGDLKPFLVEMIFVSIIEIGRFLFGPMIFIGGRCQLSFPRPDYVSAYRPFFFDQVDFDQPHNRLIFAAEHLRLPMALANPVARQLAERQCEEQLREVQQKLSLVAQVRGMLEDEEDKIPSMEEIAARLHVTSRTLRRQLQAFNTSYQELLTEVRCQRAVRLLESTNKSIEEIADQLGYSDASNFGRAFRKWTGRKPSDYRRG